VDLDTSDTMNKKIRNAQLAQYNFILVVGEKEALNGTVNVRTRDNKVTFELKQPVWFGFNFLNSSGTRWIESGGGDREIQKIEGHLRQKQRGMARLSIVDTSFCEKLN